MCVCARVHACDNRITGVICIEHLSRNWKWDREGWRGFRDISPHQSLSPTKTNTHTDFCVNTHAHLSLLITCKWFHLKVTEPAWRSLPGVTHSGMGAINQCSPFWPLSLVSHWIYSSTPRCHIKLLPPASEVSLSRNERVYGNINRPMRWEVLRAAFIREPHNTNGIIARWAGVEPDQCKTIITGWSSRVKRKSYHWVWAEDAGKSNPPQSPKYQAAYEDTKSFTCLFLRGINMRSTPQ